MIEEDILEDLCVYDPRSPYFTELLDKPESKDCYCDNCFYGRSKLAIEILKLKTIIKNLNYEC